jgi:hypothetical protein
MLCGKSKICAQNMADLLKMTYLNQRGMGYPAARQKTQEQ